MRTRHTSTAAGWAVLAVVGGLASGAAAAEAQRACLEGRGGIMTDLGLELDPGLAHDFGAGVAGQRFESEPRVVRVREDGPTAGRLEEGDVIVAVAGHPVTSAEAARRYAALRPGDRVQLSIRRGGRRLDVSVVAMGRCVPHPPPPPAAPAPPPAPDAPAAPAPPLPPDEELMPRGWFGFAIRCDECAEDPATGVLRFHAPPIVAAVEPGSPAAAAGIQAGDRLTHMNGEPLTSASGWARFYAIQPGEVVRFRIARDGRSLDVSLQAQDPPSPGRATRPRHADPP